jgi:hypothetical protein
VLAVDPDAILLGIFYLVKLPDRPVQGGAAEASNNAEAGLGNMLFFSHVLIM